MTPIELLRYIAGEGLRPSHLDENLWVVVESSAAGCRELHRVVGVDTSGCAPTLKTEFVEFLEGSA